MKKLSLICGLVLVLSACQRHSASELNSIEPQEHADHAAAAQHEKDAK